MNEKIKEFAKNYLMRSEYTESGCQECHYYRFDQDELDNFAELIIRECAEIASDYNGAHYVGTTILQHFGVEE